MRSRKMRRRHFLRSRTPGCALKLWREICRRVQRGLESVGKTAALHWPCNAAFNCRITKPKNATCRLPNGYSAIGGDFPNAVPNRRLLIALTTVDLLARQESRPLGLLRLAQNASESVGVSGENSPAFSRE